MPSLQQAQTALDTAVAAEFPDVTVLYGNQDGTLASKGDAPYLRVRTQFADNNQMQLGRRDPSENCPRRVRGYMLFFIHVRSGTGDGPRNSLQIRINFTFATRLIGGVTLQDSRVVSVNETERWSITGIQVPFFFDQQV